LENGMVNFEREALRMGALRGSWIAGF